MRLFFNSLLMMLFLSLFTITGSAKINDPGIILSAVINSVSKTSYTIDYNVALTGIDAPSFMDQKINYPYEPSIIECTIFEMRINEKDFLYSERNIDLNGDGDTDDSFPVLYKSGMVIISGITVNPLFIKKNDRYILSSYNSSNHENSVKIKPEGHPFEIHTYEPLIGRLTAGLPDRPGGTIFREFPNSLFIIEIIQNNGEEPGNITINSQKTDLGATNEKVFSPGGENLKRHFTGINVSLNNNSSEGSIRLDNIEGNFKVRLRYLFAISSRIVLLSEKILYPDKK